MTHLAFLTPNSSLCLSGNEYITVLTQITVRVSVLALTLLISLWLSKGPGNDFAQAIQLGALSLLPPAQVQDGAVVSWPEGSYKSSNDSRQSTEFI